jgi:hypothetical protein
MPKLSDESLPGVVDGHAFYYLDVNAKSTLKPSANPLNMTNQASKR